MRQEESFDLPDKMNDFIEQLSSFEAQSKRLDRDQLMFLAGQNAARSEFLTAASRNRRTLRVWQSAAALMFASALGLWASLVLRPEPQSPVTIVEHRDSPTEEATTSVHVANTGSSNDSKSSAPGDVQETHRVQETGVADSAMPSPESLKALQARLALVEQMIGVISDPDVPRTPVKDLMAFSRHRTAEPVLDYRSLLQGEDARILINRFIEEPNL